jgi:hypothetical protein
MTTEGGGVEPAFASGSEPDERITNGRLFGRELLDHEIVTLDPVRFTES